MLIKFASALEHILPPLTFQVGGNQKARNFFDSQDTWDDTLNIQQKYNTKAAALYRDKVKWVIALIPWHFIKSAFVEQLSNYLKSADFHPGPGDAVG